jgi:hypothetical protein
MRVPDHVEVNVDVYAQEHVRERERVPRTVVPGFAGLMFRFD